jgi:hypothetical protein
MNGDSRRCNISQKRGILLDIGCGKVSRPGFVGMDKRNLPNVSIVHDLEKFPYPLKDASVITMVASHILEHIKPWLMIDFMNELWRIAKVDCQLAISMPYGYSSGFLQDPTHCNACNEATWTYFDPDFPLYQVYEPSPWKITFGPMFQQGGNMEVILTKIRKGEKNGADSPKSKDKRKR